MPWKPKLNDNNNSSADLSYAIALFRLGNSEYEIKKAILKERCNWNNHKGMNKTNWRIPVENS